MGVWKQGVCGRGGMGGAGMGLLAPVELWEGDLMPTPHQPSAPLPRAAQRYYGAAVGKGRQAAKNEVEKLKLGEMTCREGIKAVAKM